MDAKVLVILALVAAATAGPISIQDTDKCSTTCADSTKFKYNPGTTYVYNYRVDTDSSLAGAFEDSAKTTLQTSVDIQVLSPCEFSLQLRNTRLLHTTGNGALKTADRENEFRSEIEGSPLRFSFQDGVVDHVCAEREESVRSLNLKKGILSAFQNSMDDLTQNQNVTETDVAGVCKAEYKLVSNGYYTTEVKKVKDILSCTDRLDYMTMLQLTSYNVPSGLQHFPIMKTSHECEQTVENGGVLKSAVCKESHVYRPFANGENGGRTTITQTLTYQTYRNGVNTGAGAVKSRSSLLFDHSADHPTQEQARTVVEQKLNEICDTTRFSVQPETPRLFSELVAAMKGLGKTDMADLHRLLKTETMCGTNRRTYKYFHDALPMVSTSASVSLMVDLINTEDATGLEASAWLTSFAFIRYPTSEMLSDVKPLLNNKDIRTDAMLPISSMINNFCKQRDTCNQDSVVRSLISSLLRNIDNYCDASGKKFDLTLLTLKAIGNAGHTLLAAPVLNKCLTSTSSPLEIRVAAAEAFRRMPCSVKDNGLWETLNSKELDSELRINAYLSLMRCPTEVNLGKMAAFLNTEDDEQVGAFVYSHLTNLRETSDPHKQGVADAINNLALDKEFDLSPLKYSRNFEVSALINKLNTGVTAEGNLIWSNKAQLPRAVSGNLTVELFGQSINLLDFGGRLEGLEYLIKNIFGPYVNKKESWSKVDADSVKGSIYGRVFGNEMLFMHSQTAKALGDKTPNWLELLIKMSQEQHMALTQTVQFMDVCMVIPSSAGLPIHVRVNGTATVDLNMSGKMDLRKAGSSPRSMDVDGEVRPSAALEITGTLFVDSFVTKTGIRMRNTLFTSTAVKGRIQLNRGQQLNVELDTPEDKMEVFDARSKFFVMHDNIEQEQEMVKENRKEFKTCSSGFLTKITGMELCGELSFSNASMKADSPYYPLTGPTSVSVTLYKRDSHSGYKLFAKRVENKKASIAQVSINTPGSQVNRAISVDMSLNYKKQNAEFSLSSPWKKISLTGNMDNLKELKGLSGNLVVDDKDVYAMAGEVKITQSKSKLLLTPMIEVRRPSANNLQLTGSFSMEKPLKSVNMEMSLSGYSKLPYTVKAALTNTKKERSGEASITFDGKNEYSVKASNVMSIMGKKSVIAVIRNNLEVKTPKRKLVTLSSNTDYRQDKSLRHESSIFIHRAMKRPATVKVNLNKFSRKKADNYKGVFNFKSNPLTGNLVCSVNRKPNGFTSVISKIDYSMPKTPRNTINFSGKLNDKSTKAYKSYIVSSIVNVKRNPEYNSNMKFEVGHKKRLSHVTLDVKYGANPKDKTQQINFMASLNRKSLSMKKADLKYSVKAQAPAVDVDVALHGNHQHSPKLLDSKVKLTYASKKDISAEITLRDRSTKLIKMNGKTTLSWPGKEYILSSDLTQKSAKQYSHSLNFKSNSGTRHSMSTLYKLPKSDTHAVVTSIKLHKTKPIVLSGSTNLNVRNFAASGNFKYGKDSYGLSTRCKVSKAPNAKFGLELSYPTRRMTLDVSGGRMKNKYEGKVEAAWDADNNKDSKVTLAGSGFHKSAKGLVSLGGNVNFQSPFANFENILGSIKYGKDATQHSTSGKLQWGDKEDQITSTMIVKRPIRLNNLKLNGNIKTPFEGFRNADLDITHKFAQDLSTSVKGSIEKEAAKLSILGQSLSNGYKGNMKLKSTINNAESVSLDFSHTGSDGSYDSNTKLNHNGKVYAYDLKMSHSGNGLQKKTNGDLMITLNKQKINTHWDHKNTLESLQSSLNSKWNGKRFLFDLTGSHQLSDLRNINGILKINSPWKQVRDIEINIDHKHGNGLINSIAFMKHGQKKKASSTINFNKGQNNADFDFELTSPFHEDLSGKVSTNYDKYPMTTSAEFKWAPKMKSILDGSLNLESWNDADLHLKLTTPSRRLRNVVLMASNKKQAGELLSHLNLDYGMRKNIDIESRISNEDQNKMIRFKINTPFEQFKSLNTGLNFNGHANKFDTTADFELLPLLGKYDGVINWQNEDEMHNKIRLDTPLSQYPYFELSSSSMLNGRLRNSHIQIEHYPSKVYSLDATYVFDLPLSFDTTIKTPYPDFNDIGLSFQHGMTDSSFNSNGEVRYQPSKKIEANLNADWSSDIKGGIEVNTPFRDYEQTGLSFQHSVTDSSFKSSGEVRYQTAKKIEANMNADWTSDFKGGIEINTPFRGYEQNKITIRHRGQLNNFDSHGEIDVAHQNIAADASFKSGYTATGTFTFTSPIPGLEKIDLSMKKKGNRKNVRGSAVMKINEDRYQINFNNKLAKELLKNGITIMTPHTETFKVGLDHSGPLERFTNKISINYGRKVDIDTVISFDLRGDDVNGNGILKYKLNKARNTARISFGKSGPIENLSFTASSSFNRDQVSVSGSLKTKDGVEGNIEIKTPFNDFRNTGMTLSHSGPISDFISQAQVIYMDNKNVEGKLEFSTLGGKGIKLSSELTTPFKTFESTSIKFNHDINDYSWDIAGSGELITTVGGFGSGDISYSRTGDLNALTLKASASANGKEHMTFKLTNNLQETEVHSMCSLKSSIIPDVYFSIDHTADSFSLSTKTMGKVGKSMASTDTTMKLGYNSITADSSISYKLQGLGKNTASISLMKDGDLNNCNLELSGKFNDKEAKLSASKSGEFNNMRFSGSASLNKDSVDISGTWKNIDDITGTLQISTPFDTASISLVKDGDLDNCNMKLTGKFNDKEAKLSASKSGKFNNMRFSGSASLNKDSVDISGTWKNIDDITGMLQISTPFDMASISLKKDGDLDNCNLELSGKFNDKEAKLSGSKSGKLNDMHFSGSASLNKDSVDISGTWKNTDNIAGSLKVSTPFDNFRNFGLDITHTGGLFDFTSTMNMDLMNEKTVYGKVVLSANTWEDIKFVTDLSTPIENLRSLNMNFNNKYDSYTSEMNGNAAIDTTIDGFGKASITYSKTGGFNNMKVNGNVMRNGNEVAVLSINNALLDQELHSSFDLKSTQTPHVRITLDHNGDLTNFKTLAGAVVGKNIINGDLTLNVRGNIYDGEGKVLYSIEDYGSNEASITLHKEGEANNFNVELTGKYGGKESKITGNFKHEDELTGDLTLNTPFKGYKNVGLSFKHAGNKDKFDCEGKIVLADGKEFAGTINFYRYLNKRIEFIFELSTPITDFEFTKYEYRHEGQFDSFTCFSSLEYGQSNRFTYDLLVKSSPMPEIASTLKYNGMQALLISGSYENTWPKYGFTGKYEVGYDKDVFINVDGSLDIADDIVGLLSISTSKDDFNNVGMSFQHSSQSNGVNTEGKVIYMDGKIISGKAEARMTKSAGQVSLELTTPFEGYEKMGYESKVVMNRRLYKVTSKVMHGDDMKIDVEAYSKFKPHPEMSLTINRPNAQDVVAFVSLDKSWPKYELNCKLSPGNGEQFTLEGAFDATKDISGSIKIGTPLDEFNSIGMNFVHSGDNEKFGTEGTLTYKDGKELFGKVNFYRYMWQRVDASVEVTTPFVGMENTKAEVNFEDNTNSISTTAAVEYNNGEKLNGNIKITHSPNYEVLITVNTPFSNNAISTQAALDITAPTYEATWSLNNGNNKVYSVDSKFSLFSAQHMEGSVEVNTPMDGFEYTKAEYQHKVDSSDMEGSVSLVYDDGKKMSCEVKSTLSPRFDGTITVKTPFNGFEKMEGAASYEESYKKYETSSSLDFGQGSIFSMSSELDYSIEPIKASTKINTPFKSFSNVELDITHEGGLTNFKTTGFLSSPLTDHVNAKASLKFDAIMDMSAAASLQSPIPGFDDLKMELRTSDLPGEMKTNALFGWTSGEQITYEGLYQKQEGWNGDKMHTDVSISTPFVAVQNVNLQMDHSAQSSSYSGKVNFELNGDSLLDFDTELLMDEKKSAELTVRKPWPMQYTASKTSHDGTTDAEVFVNWNRDEINSNVLLRGSLTDKSDNYYTDNALDLSVTYASRKVGVVHKFSEKSSEVNSNGHVYWDSDDDSKVSYDMQINDNSRRNKEMRDGSFKLALPTRTLGLSGSYSKNAAAIVTNGIFSWDADRDDSKQFGVKATINNGDSLKGDVTFSMPSIRKEIRVNGEVMLNNGRVILDTQTDISYSKDSRKTLTLFSKLEDISPRYSGFNYSFALGVKHPYTNVDIEMNSHIGSSNELMTLGMATNYLTSKRQMKNLALLSEINTLKKQINVQVFNPLNKIEIVGDIISEKPYKLRFLNKIDDTETFRSDMTLDSKKNSFSFNAFVDSEIWSFSAKYPNKTAFQADFKRHTPTYDHEEALLAVRLNTSRLMHTRLSWCPNLKNELEEYNWQRVLVKAETMMMELTSINDAIAEEIEDKYVAISKEISQELQPLISALSHKLSFVADKMTELSFEMREMYNRNDFNVQKMGETFIQLQEKLNKFASEYRSSYTELISTLREKLNELQHYPIRAYYTQFMTESAEWLVKESAKSLASLEEYIVKLDLSLKEYKASMQGMKQKTLDTIYNTTYVDYLASKVQNIDVSPYISSFDLPEEYTNAIYNVPSQIGARFTDALDGYKMDSLNEVYQQGVWAYNYWKLEENLEKHLKSLLANLREIIEEELKEYSEDLKSLVQNPITVWDPEHGEIQADIPLPVAVRRLDRLPNLTPLVKKAEKFVAVYMPDQGTWDNLSQSVSDLWATQTKADDELNEELTKFKPSRGYRKKGRKYKVKRQ